MTVPLQPRHMTPCKYVYYYYYHLHTNNSATTCHQWILQFYLFHFIHKVTCIMPVLCNILLYLAKQTFFYYFTRNKVTIKSRLQISDRKAQKVFWGISNNDKTVSTSWYYLLIIMALHTPVNSQYSLTDFMI